MNVQTSPYPGRWCIMNVVLCLVSHSLYHCFSGVLGINKQKTKPNNNNKNQTKNTTKTNKQTPSQTYQIKLTRTLRKEQNAAEERFRLPSLGSKIKVSNPDQKHRETNTLQRRSLFRRPQYNTTAVGASAHLHQFLLG